MRPVLLRPPFFGRGTTSDFSGSLRVTSEKSATLAPRRPGVVGLYLRMPMGCRVLVSCSSARLVVLAGGGAGPGGAGGRAAEDVDPVALGQRHDRTLGGNALAPPEAGALALAGAVDRVDARH